MKKYLLGVIALFAIVVAGSAFVKGGTAAKQDKSSLYFYRYTALSHQQGDIEERTNYVRAEESCDEGDRVCGVYLPTDQGLGNPPSISDFNTVVSDLWASEQANSPTIDEIVMKE